MRDYCPQGPYQVLTPVGKAQELRILDGTGRTILRVTKASDAETVAQFVVRALTLAQKGE